MKTLIIDYDAGNLHSVQRACREVGMNTLISSDPDVIRSADRLVFPGVGAAAPAMRSITESGVDVALREVIAAGRPVLGICLGMQISLEHSEEGDTPTLGLMPGVVRRFKMDDPSLKVPHMGWNAVQPCRPHPVLDGIEEGDEFYFVHGYYPSPSNAEHALARTTYEGEFVSALGHENYVGTQFHPEKSGRVGLRLIERFASWDGTC